MSCLTPATAIAVLIHFTMATQALEPSACQLPACSCDEATHRNDVSNGDETYTVACFVKSFTHSDPTVAQFTPEITSLKLVCSDPHAQSSLTSDSFHKLPDLVHLGLENCNFVTTKVDAFHSTPKLQSLEIKSCQFTEMPKDLFSKTPRLSRLTITQCGLQTLPRLCHLRALEILNVSGQGLLSMDEGVRGCGSDFALQNLTVLDISNNSLVEAPQALVEKVSSLKELYIGENKIKELSLGGATELEVLDALGQALHSADFMGGDLPAHLKILKLEGNGMVEFPTEKLQGFPNLTYLHLEEFGVTDRVWRVLPWLDNLQHLLVPANHISSVTLTASNVHLTHLNLTTNAITLINASSFASQKGLVEVDLSHNNITKVMKGVFVNMPWLKTLKLNNNQLRMVLQSGFKNLPSLQFLFLNRNNLASLPIFYLREMPSLKVLDVSYNHISGLPYLTRSPELVLLNANFNNITTLMRSGISGLTNLEHMYLRGNMLQAVYSPVFLNAPSLLILDLRENQISRVEPFGNHPSLMFVLLEENRIQDVSLVFRQLPRLTTLFLDNNLLTRLTVNMFPPSLRTLSVAWNLLTHIDRGLFTHMPALTSVSLGANYHLTQLLLPMVQVPPTLLPKPAMTVGPNVFRCDCHMAYLKAWALTTASGRTPPFLRDNLPHVLGLQTVECRTHFSENNVMFDDVPLSHFVCPYKAPLCDDACTCCTAHAADQTHSHSNCTCVLTCPDACTCFYGGSKYVKLVTHVLCNDKNLTQFPESVPARATHVRMDGNYFTVLRSKTLSRLTDVVFVHLNNSRVETVEQGSFEGLGSLEVIDLSHNRLASINETTFGNIPSLTELNLQHNQIEYIHPEAFSGLRALEKLWLEDNRLKEVESFAHFPRTALLTLANNPWTCSCRFADRFLKYLITHRNNVIDYGSLRCYWYDADATVMDRLNNSSSGLVQHVTPVGEKPAESNGVSRSRVQHGVSRSRVQHVTPVSEKPAASDGVSRLSTSLSKYKYSLLCRRAADVILPAHRDQDGAAQADIPRTIVIVIIVVLVVGVVVGVVGVWRWREIQACLYMKLGMRLWDNAARLDREEEEEATVGNKVLQVAAAAPCAYSRPRIYDAFVSYSHHDEDFVVQQLLPRLEQQGPRHYKLCVHFRDFPVGDAIADSITESVEASRRTLLLLSNNFVDSEWCRFEFRAAHQHVLREGGHRLIIVLLEDVAQDRLDPDLRMAMKTRTYLSLKDPWFWEKLCFALPHVPRRHRHHGNQAPGAAAAAEPEREARRQPDVDPEDVGVRLHNDSDTRVNEVLQDLDRRISHSELSGSSDNSQISLPAAHDLDPHNGHTSLRAAQEIDHNGHPALRALQEIDHDDGHPSPCAAQEIDHHDGHPSLRAPQEIDHDDGHPSLRAAQEIDHNGHPSLRAPQEIDHDDGHPSLRAAQEIDHHDGHPSLRAAQEIDHNGHPALRALQEIDHHDGHPSLRAAQEIDHNGHPSLRAAQEIDHNGHTSLRAPEEIDHHNGHTSLRAAQEIDHHNGHTSLLAAQETDHHNGHTSLSAAQEIDHHNGHTSLRAAQEIDHHNSHTSPRVSQQPDHHYVCVFRSVSGSSGNRGEGGGGGDASGGERKVPCPRSGRTPLQERQVHADGESACNQIELRTFSAGSES